jgi:hypothetical protein
MKLIDKSALVAEIERRLHFDNNWIEGDKRRQIHTNGVSSVYYRMIGSKHACERILDFIDTLEVKEVDLETSIEDYINSHFTEGCDGGMISDWYKVLGGVHYNDLKDIAKHFFELGMSVSNKV